MTLAVERGVAIAGRVVLPFVVADVVAGLDLPPGTVRGESRGAVEVVGEGDGGGLGGGLEDGGAFGGRSGAGGGGRAETECRGGHGEGCHGGEQRAP